MSRWIDATQIQPNGELDVLVATAKGFVAIGWYRCEFDDWIVDKNVVKVTHWQPLPKPPKKGRKKP